MGAAAGPAIAAAARPTAERDGVLTVTCDAAVWAQELDMMAGELIPRITPRSASATFASCAAARAERPDRARRLPK